MINKIIYFSGSSSSGKSTTINFIKEELNKKGFTNIIDYSEIIRNIPEVKNKSIDELRKNSHEYLMIEDKIIREKIEQEKSAILDNNSDKIYLFDRCITDSLYYLISYTEKSKFIENDYIIYSNLINHIIDHINFLKSCIIQFHTRFSLLEFLPMDINAQTEDMRPKNIEILKKSEYNIISIFNSYFENIRTYIKCDSDNFNYKINTFIDYILQ